MNKTTTLALGIVLIGSSLLTVNANAQFYDREDIKNRAQNSERWQNASADQHQQAKKRYGYWRNWKQDVTKVITKLDNGVSVTLTTENEKILAKLHERQGRKTEKITMTITKLDNGIIVSTTSSDREIVASLHKRADNHQTRKSITRNVETLDNGVRVTITSNNAEAASQIQDRDRKDIDHEAVTKVVNLLDNGVEITITSENPAFVERIQKRAERKGLKRKGQNFKRFNKGFNKARNFTDGQ